MGHCGDRPVQGRIHVNDERPSPQVKLRMKRRGMLGLAAATVAFGCLTAHTNGALPPAQGKIRFQVLYVGHSQTPREKDFVDLLEKYFVKVGRGELDAFREKDVEGYDAVILDYGELKIVGNTIQTPKVPFGDRYSRPTVTIGAAGALVCGRLKLKTGYL